MRSEKMEVHFYGKQNKTKKKRLVEHFNTRTPVTKGKNTLEKKRVFHWLEDTCGTFLLNVLHLGGWSQTLRTHIAGIFLSPNECFDELSSSFKNNSHHFGLDLKQKTPKKCLPQKEGRKKKDLEIMGNQ